MKTAIKPFYQRKEITKEEYKEIVRKAVEKVKASRSPDAAIAQVEFLTANSTASDFVPWGKEAVGNKRWFIIHILSTRDKVSIHLRCFFFVCFFAVCLNVGVFCFGQVCHSKSGEVNSSKVANLVKAYVDKYKHARKK